MRRKTYTNIIIVELIQLGMELCRNLINWISALKRIYEDDFLPILMEGTGKENRAATAIYMLYEDNKVQQKKCKYLGKKALVEDNKLYKINIVLVIH